MQSIPQLPTLFCDEQFLDYISTRVNQAVLLKKKGMEEESQILLQSARMMAEAADDPQSLGLVYASIPYQEQ